MLPQTAFEGLHVAFNAESSHLALTSAEGRVRVFSTGTVRLLSYTDSCHALQAGVESYTDAGNGRLLLNIGQTDKHTSVEKDKVSATKEAVEEYTGVAFAQYQQQVSCALSTRDIERTAAWFMVVIAR